jgi:SAM-dependent methyltransferase
MTPETLDQARERLRPYVEGGRAATGWGFPVHARKLQPRNWNYDARARELLHDASAVLDIGTGGGERFSDYCTSYTGRAIATEGWYVNAPIAHERLHPLGIEVIHCDDEYLAFATSSFDLVLNRHSALDPHDVARVLKPGGRLLTEQVWGHWRELKRYFPGMSESPGLLLEYSDGLRRAGLELIDCRAHIVPAAFEHLGDFVFMLSVASWTVPGLDPLGKDLETLLRLENDLTTEDGLVLSDGAFIIEARKPFGSRITYG